MRLTDLLGVEVVDRDGLSRGKVLDVRMGQRGPLIGSFGAALQPEWLLIGRRAIGARLGYDRREVRGPLPLRATARYLHRNARLAPWQSIRSIQGHRIDLRAAGQELRPLDPEDRAGAHGSRTLDVGQEVLDHQLLDLEGRMAGKCDDLRFAFPEGGGAAYVDAILAGPGALESRIGGRPGRWMASVHTRLQDPEAEGPASIGFGVVKRLGSAIELAVHRDDLDIMRFEAWVRDNVISKMPGAG
jgi:hypothetical protein